MKTRILPTVGKKYISRKAGFDGKYVGRKTGIVVEATEVTRYPRFNGVFVRFTDVAVPDSEYRFSLDDFWRRYQVMEVINE